MPYLNDLTFAVLDGDGAPLPGLAASAVWTGFDVRTGGRASAPALTDLGGGLYCAARRPKNGAHVSGVWDFGHTAGDGYRYALYDCPTDDNDDFVLLLRSAADGSLLDGATVLSFAPSDIVTGVAVTAPPVRGLGGGLYAVRNCAQPGQHVAGMIDFGPTAATRRFEYDAGLPPSAPTPSLPIAATIASAGTTSRRSLKLDPDTLEPVIENGRLVWLSGAESIAQAIRLAFGLMRGEWFLDQDAGCDWFSVLGQKYDANRARAMARDVLASVAGVAEIVSLEPSFDTATRTATIAWSVGTDYGPLNGSNKVATT